MAEMEVSDDDFVREIQEELKKRTPAKPLKDTGFNELQNLIGSLKVDFESPKANKGPQNSPDRSKAASSGKIRAVPGVGFDRISYDDDDDDDVSDDDTLKKARDLLRAVDDESTAEAAVKDAERNKQKLYDMNRKDSSKKNNIDEVTKIKFGTLLSIRHEQGRYMSVLCSDPSSNKDDNTNVNISTISAVSTNTMDNKKNNEGDVTYTLAVEGQGIGEEVDCLCFVNSDNREDTSTVRYGSTVSLKSAFAKDRYLSVRDGKFGFFRSLIGKAEKWTVVKCVSSKGVEDTNSVGTPVCTGDMIMLAVVSSGELLSVYDGVSGRVPRLIIPNKLRLGEEVWRLELFGCPPLPSFMSRPYLSGRFMTIPASVRYGSEEAEGRTFPGRKSYDSTSSSRQGPKLSDYDPAVQYAVLTREVLCALSGVEGQYIRVAAATASSNSSGVTKDEYQNTGEISLVLDIDDLDRSVACQVKLLLPICECGIRIREFIKVHSKYEYGKVSQALASGIRGLLREFDLLVAQLEMLELKQKLSLQTIMFHLHPSKVTLKSLDRLCSKVRNTSGGRMLDALYACLLDQGDENIRELHSFLFKTAAEPFIMMLQSWLFKGELHDPYKEFMIQEDRSLSKEGLEHDFNSQYWEERYKLRTKHVPKILKGQGNSLAQMILTAGKYLSVVRGCFQGRIKLPEEEPLKIDPNSLSALSKAVTKVYTFASQVLLKMLEEQHGLSTHLKSLRRFFLLEHGDFFTQFMDIAEGELRREAKDIAETRIHSLLQLAIQTSTLANDPHKEELSCSLANHNLIQHLHLIQSAGESNAPGLGQFPPDTLASLETQGLKGIEALTLDYNVGWPVSILLSKRAIAKYQLLNRLLFFSKHVELRVLTSWYHDQSTKHLDVRGMMSSSYCLRHRMLHFLQNFTYYMTLEVISPKGHEMHSEMEEAVDMDQVINLHEQFLDACLKECLLASQDLLKILTKLMTTCLLFADQMKRFFDENLLTNEQIQLDKVTAKTTVEKQKHSRAKAKIRTEFINREASHESYQRTLSKFSSTFDSQLAEFLSKLWTASSRHHPQLLNLCVRLDYNGFYSRELGGDLNESTMSGQGGVSTPINQSFNFSVDNR